LLGDFLKGLIQTAAAGVKVRQGIPRGVASLGQGAEELFERVLSETNNCLGLGVEELRDFARELAKHPDRDPGPASSPVQRVLSLVLRPERGQR
jgi:hypothetical protein